MIKSNKKFWGSFREFITKGNAVNLAVGVILGGAFQGIINSVVNDIFMPVINLFIRKINARDNFSEKFWDLTPDSDGTLITAQAAISAGHLVITYGAVISAIINFLLIGFVVFLIVHSLNSVGDLGKKAARFARRHPNETPPAPKTQQCPYCITEIDVRATRCPNCTSQLIVDN